MLTSTWQDLIGTSVAERYVLRNIVYSGRRQAEFLADSNGGEMPVSVALVAAEPYEIAQELEAISRARELKHSNLLQVMDGGECQVDDTKLLFVVTEVAQGTLADAITAGQRPNPKELVEDLLAPLAWLHSQKLIYRNLDPETVVRANGHWKLADLSQVHAAGQFDAAETAARNAPPEAADGWILPAWDSWTIGVLLRDLLGGENGVLPAPFDTIVRGCLEPDHMRRLSLDDIGKLLKPALAAVPAAAAAPAPAPAPTTPAPAAISAMPPPRALRSLEPEPSRSRAPLVAVAVLAVLALVLFLLFRPHSESAASRVETPHRAAIPPATAPPQTAVAPPTTVKQPPVETSAPPAKHPSPFDGRISRPATTAAAASTGQTGRADYFSDDLEGHLTAKGEPFSNSALTAASRQFPLGSRVRVTNLKNNRSVTVRVNDRGPTRHDFVITVTRRAAEELDFVRTGSARVKVEPAK
jgi:rare lipoprotein A